MPLKTLHCKQAAAQRARGGKLAKKSMTDTPVTVSSSDTETDNVPSNLIGPIFIEDDCEECGYDGGVEDWIDASDEEDTLSDIEGSTGAMDSDEELLEYDEEIMEGLKIKLRKANQYKKLIAPKNWARVEANWSLGYAGHSERTRFRRNAESRKQKEMHEAAKTSWAESVYTLPEGKAYEKLHSLDLQVSMMRSFFQPKAAAANPHELEQTIIAPAEQVNYLSDD